MPAARLFRPQPRSPKAGASLFHFDVQKSCHYYLGAAALAAEWKSIEQRVPITWTKLPLWWSTPLVRLFCACEGSAATTTRLSHFLQNHTGCTGAPIIAFERWMGLSVRPRLFCRGCYCCFGAAGGLAAGAVSPGVVFLVFVLVLAFFFGVVGSAAGA